MMGVKGMMAAGLLAIGLSMPGVSAAAANGQNEAPEVKQAKDDGSKRICRSIRPTGSRMSTRVCRTQAEWTRSQDKSQDSVLQHQMRETTTYGPGGGPL
jgi:hypothetical protein